MINDVNQICNTKYYKYLLLIDSVEKYKAKMI